MEQTRAQAQVNELKKQLVMIDDAHLAKMYSEAKRDIEHHFDDLFKSINTRKEALLKSLESSFVLLKTMMAEEQTQLQSKVEIATKTLELGESILLTNKSAANSVLKSIDFMTHHPQEFKLQAILPKSLVHMINLHGSVLSQPLRCQQGVVMTHAGSSAGCVDGAGELAKFNYPVGVVFNPNGNSLYVCDFNNSMIRKVTSYGKVSVFCKVSNPHDIAYDGERKLFYVSTNAHTIQQITSEGVVSLFAGIDGKLGHSDGARQKAYLNIPGGIIINPHTKDLYVSDFGNNTISKINQEGVVATLAGNKNKSGHSDGMKENAQFKNPVGLVFHTKKQELIVCDWGNHCLRRITMDGNVITLHQVPSPRFISLLTDDIALVSSSTNRIFKVQLSDVNKVEVFAGKEEGGYKDGPALDSQFTSLEGLAFDSATNTCYVADRSNHKIRKISII